MEFVVMPDDLRTASPQAVSLMHCDLPSMHVRTIFTVTTVFKRGKSDCPSSWLGSKPIQVSKLTPKTCMLTLIISNAGSQQTESSLALAYQFHQLHQSPVMIKGSGSEIFPFSFCTLKGTT